MPKPSVPPITDDRQVTDGRYVGRKLPLGTLEGKVPLPGSVRRELFSLLGNRVRGERFLDLCAGTGMAGIEAISRGASLSSFVERKAKRCAMIRDNLKALGIKFGHGEIFEEEIAGFLKRMAARRRFWDNVFFDPPFDADYDDAFRFFGTGAIIRNKGFFAIRHHSAMFFPESIGGLRRTKVAAFGEEALSIYQKRS